LSREITIATGASALARARAETVAQYLRTAWPDEALSFRWSTPDEAEASTGGARSPISPAETVCEWARRELLEERADLAVHGYDELPLGERPGLRVAAVPQRSDPRDAMVSASGKVLAYLPEGTRIGTDSGRRSGQMLRRRSDVSVLPVTGAAVERLALLDAGEYDALIFSAAELDYLGLRSRIIEHFDHDQMIPAPGQAALALEIRAADHDLSRLLLPMNDEFTAYAILAERACQAALGADPDRKLGVHAFTDGDRMSIFGIAISDDGTRTARMQWNGPWRDAQDLGETLALLLMSIGADKILLGEEIPPTARYSMRPGGNTGSGLGFGGGPGPAATRLGNSPDGDEADRQDAAG
jgi:hydroxymethylbilane synthase